MLKAYLKRLLTGFVVFVLLSLSALLALYQYGLKAPLSEQSAGRQYTVRSGSGLSRVAFDLVKQDILSYPSALAWILYTRVTKRAHQLKAGDYEVPPGITAWQLLDMMLRGDTIQYSLTLLEGWNFFQVMKALREHPKIKSTLKGLDGEAVMKKLGYPGIHPEGRFYPDTYHFAGNTSDAELLRQAYQKMAKELTAAWQLKSADAPFKTPEELLTLASIVEKETAVAEERERVAGVFVQRLNKNMRLQTDPTVIYGLGEKFDGDLRSADLKNDTPYNTYTRHGLPPTPIAMPGRAALRAAATPLLGGELYFVAKGDGSHYFSKNLREHNCAVIRFQLKDKAPLRFKEKCQAYPSCPACR